MDYKNPNKTEEDLGDPVALLEKYNKAKKDVEIIQDQLMAELTKILGGN